MTDKQELLAARRRNGRDYRQLPVLTHQALLLR